MKAVASAVLVTSLACGTVAPTNTYVLDFRKSNPLTVNQFTHVAFTIDSAHPLRSYALNKTSTNSLPDFIQSDSTFIPCPRTGIGAPAPTLIAGEKLPAGTPASVAAVDFEALESPGVTWKMAGACVGYRTPDGAWHWETSIEPTPFAYDASRHSYRMHLPLGEVAVDAVELWFNMNAIPSQPVQTITYTIR